MKKSTILNLISAILVSSAAYAQSINTSDLRGYVGGLYMGEESLRQASSFTDEQLLYGPGISIGGEYGDYDADQDTDRRFEGSAETMSASVAYVHPFEAFNLGVVLTAVDAEFDANGTDTNKDVSFETEGDGFLVTIGAAKQWDKLSLVFKATIGELSFDTARENGQPTATPITKTADYDVSLYQFEFTALYALIQDEDYELSPFLVLGYASLQGDGFDEGSNSADRVNFEDYEDDRPYAELGINGRLLSMGNFLPYASLSVWQDLGDDGVEFVVDDRVTNVVSFETPDAAQTVIKGALGFGWAVNESWDIDAGAGYFVGDEIDGFNLSLSTTVRF